MFRTTLTAAALGALSITMGSAGDVQASSLVVDRGLPTTNLNNAAGSDRSNVAWGFGGDFFSGDTFTLPSTGNPSMPSWRVDKLTAWFIADDPGSTAPLSDSVTDISLFLGRNSGPGGTIEKVAGSAISGDSATAPNVTLSEVTYDGGVNYQASSGAFRQIWQVDFTDLGSFAPGEYAFSVGGLPTPFFSHASNDALDGVPSDGADNLYYWFRDNGGGSTVEIGGTIDSNGNGWDKSSDINVQVVAAPVPLPAGGILLLTALGGLGGAGAMRRRRKDG